MNSSYRSWINTILAKMKFKRWKCAKCIIGLLKKEKSNFILSINFSTSETWKQIHNSIFPNYLKTFNYKLTWNLLPVKSKSRTAAYHKTNLCSFCNSFEKTVSHLFVTWVKLNSVWDFIVDLLFKLTRYTISMIYYTLNFFLFFNFSFLNISHCHKQLDAIVFSLSITNRSIWTHKN